MTRSRFLVVDDDPALQRSLARVVRRHGEPVVAGTFADAATLVRDDSSWTGFVFDVLLPDGSGLDLLALARDRHPFTPALLLTGTNRDAAANAAFDLGARYVVKPVVAGRIEAFLTDAASLASRVERVLRQWIARYALSEAEADLLGRTALGENKPAIMAARATSRETIKKQVGSLLAKTLDDSLHGAAERLLRDVARA